MTWTVVVPAGKNENFLFLQPQVWIALALVLITLAVFLQVHSFEFINYDTDRYVYENQYVKSGLTIESVGWAFTAIYASNWHPVTWLSHMLDVQLFGVIPGHHHLSNILFHVANTLLLFLIFARMTGNYWKSGLVAMLFAIHPLHVQSVAWVAERKDVLSTFFGLLTVVSYWRYVRCPGIGKYLPILLFFILSLMSKPMLVTLPFVLLLLDYWPLQRVQFSKATPPDRSGPYRSSKIKLVVEKIPLLLVSAASCTMTLHVQHDGGAVASLAAYPFELRAINALVAYASYIGKMIWPVNLAVLYPYSTVFPGWQVWTAALMLAGISFLALKYCVSHPWLLVGWLWYLGTLVPVIGLVQAGSQAMADRYTYVPLIGMFIILVWGLASLTQRYRINPITKAGIAAVGIGALAVVSWNQVGYWQNSITLFRRALEVTENNYIAHNNLGHRLLELGKIDEARRHFKASIDIKPEFEIAHLNLGLALANQGKIDQAIKHYTQALRIKPQYAVAHNNIGNAWYRLGRADIASSHYLSAIEIQPDYADAYNNLGAALIRMGQAKRSVFFFSKALEINPEFEAARQNLANTISALENRKAKRVGSK